MPQARGAAAVTLATRMSRGLRLRCPFCGEAALFQGWAMRETCDACGRDHRIAPGEWSGAVMIAQMLAGLLTIPAYLLLTYTTDLTFSTRVLVAVATVAALMMSTYRNVKGAWFGFLHAADDVQHGRHRPSDGTGHDPTGAAVGPKGPNGPGADKP